MQARVLAVALLLAAGVAGADTFGTGANQFTMDFVTISASTNPASGYGVVNHDYRIGEFEVTNDQWNKFKASVGGTVTGSPSSAYANAPQYTGANVATNNASWYEAAQFVNWLDTSAGYQAAYKFTGTQGTSNYTFAAWSSTDPGYNAADPYRNSNAVYYLPSENEWVKAAYWNGVSLQTNATKAGDTLTQGNGISGTGWNYYTTQYATSPKGPWAVGSGSRELNGTYDMMGNTTEWLENSSDGSYGATSNRLQRGGSFNTTSDRLASTYRVTTATPATESGDVGFRVASNLIPEPATLTLIVLGGLAMLKRRRK